MQSAKGDELDGKTWSNRKLLKGTVSCTHSSKRRRTRPWWGRFACENHTSCSSNIKSDVDPRDELCNNGIFILFFDSGSKLGYCKGPREGDAINTNKDNSVEGWLKIASFLFANDIRNVPT